MLAARLLGMLTARSLGMLAARSLGMLAAHSLGMLTAHSLGMLTARSLGTLTARSLGMLAARSFGMNLHCGRIPKISFGDVLDAQAMLSIARAQTQKQKAFCQKIEDLAPHQQSFYKTNDEKFYIKS